MACGQRGLNGLTAAPPAMPERLFDTVIALDPIMAEKTVTDQTSNLVHAFCLTAQVLVHAFWLTVQVLVHAFWLTEHVPRPPSSLLDRLLFKNIFFLRKLIMCTILVAQRTHDLCCITH